MAKKVFQASIDISAPAEVIYLYTTDLNKLPLWTDTVKVENISENVVGVGTTYIESYKYRAKLVEVKSTITQMVPGNYWEHISKAAAYTYKIKHTFEEKEQTTHVTSLCELEFGGVFGLSLWFHFISERMGKRQLFKNLEKLKVLMETEDQTKVSSE